MGGAALAPRRPWRGRRVVLGVTGGIAAYKSVQLARDLTRLGAEVDVLLTRAARAFVGAITFEAVTGRPVRTEILAPGYALDHIRLARAADAVCIAPATADVMARASHGEAGDMLTAVLLATRAPVLVCPAMNDRMFGHPQTGANLRHLTEVLGYEIVGPATGPLAYGEGEGPGRLEEPDVILQHIGRALEGTTPLSGLRVVVTAGPTREPIDPVRYLSNRSSGRMGFALAAASWRRGAEVELIAGPTSLPPPHGPTVTHARTADDMEAAVRAALSRADILLMAAAIADFRPAHAAGQKIKKEAGLESLPLEPAPDVLQMTREARRPGLTAVGFALETENARDNARRKLESKGLDLVVLNDATEPGAGFEVDTNRVTLISASGTAEELPLLSKDEVAEEILDRLVALRAARVR